MKMPDLDGISSIMYAYYIFSMSQLEYNIFKWDSSFRLTAAIVISIILMSCFVKVSVVCSDKEIKQVIVSRSCADVMWSLIFPIGFIYIINTMRIYYNYTMFFNWLFIFWCASFNLVSDIYLYYKKHVVSYYKQHNIAFNVPEHPVVMILGIFSFILFFSMLYHSDYNIYKWSNDKIVTVFLIMSLCYIFYLVQFVYTVTNCVHEYFEHKDSNIHKG